MFTLIMFFPADPEVGVNFFTPHVREFEWQNSATNYMTDVFQLISSNVPEGWLVNEEGELVVYYNKEDYFAFICP